MTRLFVAVWPPAEVVERLAAAPRPQAAGVRWTTPDQWHVTLRFLGDADADEVAACLDRVAVGPVAAELGPSVTTLGSRVVTVPVTGLDRLAADVRAATGHLGRREQYPYSGHLTLARTRGDAACPLVGATITAGFTVTDFALVESELTPHGARYKIRMTFPRE